ncbi:hypothetical protein Nepgr_000392 [Nepenthes gracilis]|uniref:Acyl-CoA oxidase C-terminal domain-containing protein n=1 Tax=Nepenthes gracilis TaxID=150966 RepID=A0AAD3P567_NEPGR|nr:hypothetical protein Nepgr_000392 [Nepenthes gracilis]
MDGYAPIIPSQLTSSSLRCNRIQALILVLRSSFINDTEQKVPDGPLKNVSDLLRSLHALIILEEGASFLRYGYLSKENAASARQVVQKLCSELRPHALALVTSSGIPDAFLGPIAFDWIDVNSWSSVRPSLRCLSSFAKGLIDLFFKREILFPVCSLLLSENCQKSTV